MKEYKYVPHPYFWAKNKDGLDIYVGLTDYEGDDALRLVACDKDGRRLACGTLMFFSHVDGTIGRAPFPSQQVPCEISPDDRVEIK